MILLVIGLVAVIVVVLIAVFLSIRLGRGDEDDEPEMRPSGRDRRRDQDERWRERDTRRVPSPARGSASRGRGEYDGYGSRGPALGRGGGAGASRERDSRGRGYDGAPRRPSRPDAPGYRKQAARPAVAASAPARGRYDSGAPRRHADDFPSADYPSMDLGPAGSYPAGDHPSVEFPVADYEAMDGPRDRPDSRRKPAPAPAAAKSRSRQRGKRDDDDDWPSTEWDQLSDEQYWAELSADKPLSTTARPSKPARDPAATAPANGGAKAQPAARDSRPARPPAPERDLPVRKERGPVREPVTERLPVRAAARQAAPPPPPPPPARLDADAATRSFPQPHALPDSGPRASRDTGPHRTRDTGPLAARNTGPQPRPDHRGRDTTGPHAARDRDLAALAGLASAPPPIPGALEDDPLTSPSFSLKAGPATDSRSYSNARKHAKPEVNGAAHPNGNGNGHGSGSYPTADYASPDGYAYQSAPPAPAAEWYSAPPVPAAPPAEAQTPAYGNPYQYTGGGNGGSPAGFADNQATAGYPGYLADPLRVYAPPGYDAQAPYAEPAAPAHQAPPAAGTVPYADGYSGHPYPEQAGYQDEYHAAGHVPGYEEGYRADPYAAGGYGPYPPQG